METYYRTSGEEFFLTEKSAGTGKECSLSMPDSSLISYLWKSSKRM